MATCPPDWKHSDTRNRCEHPDISHRDPLLDAPLTSLSTNTTYQNWHCAYCHGDLDAANTVIWDANFTCYSSEPSTALTDETIAEHLSFNLLTSEWNLNISQPTSNMTSSQSTRAYIQRSTDNNKQEIYSNCSLIFTAPEMELQTRMCKKNEIRRCSDSWNDAEVKAQCEAYTARLCSGQDTYRNRHCLLCNNFDVPEPCNSNKWGGGHGGWGASKWGGYGGHGASKWGGYGGHGGYGTSIKPPFSVLLNWRRLKREGCPSSEIYDPLSCVCRKVFI